MLSWSTCRWGHCQELEFASDWPQTRTYPDLSRAALSLSRHPSPHRDSAACLIRDKVVLQRGQREEYGNEENPRAYPRALLP
jgi:hypothetical protein